MSLREYEPTYFVNISVSFGHLEQLVKKAVEQNFLSDSVLSFSDKSLSFWTVKLNHNISAENSYVVIDLKLPFQ